MGGRVKLGNGKNMGYIGYHNTWDGKKVFLRSKCEFIVARMLDKEKTPYLLESFDYIVDGVGYRPDFFIYSDTNYKEVVKIIEVKGQDNKKEAIKYLDKYRDFFINNGVEYDVLWNYHPITKKYGLYDDINYWVKNSVENYDHVSDVSGKHNPMYGKAHKQETKDIISKKAKKRCQNENYLKKMSETQKEYWSSDEGIERRRQLSQKRIEQYNKINPYITVNCELCGNKFNKRKNSDKKFCSSKCLRKWSYNNIESYGKHTKKGYKKTLLTYIDKIKKHYNISFDDFLDDIDNVVKKSKIDGIIPKNKGISFKTLKKYDIIN